MKHRETQDKFKTGAQRDNSTLKGRPSLVAAVAFYRDAIHLEKGGLHYEDRNWEKGMPYCRTIDSVLRHIFQFLAGMDDEDHLAAARFGLQALMYYEEAIKVGSLPGTLDDRPGDHKKILESFLTTAENAAKLETKANAEAAVDRMGAWTRRLDDGQ